MNKIVLLFLAYLPSTSFAELKPISPLEFHRLNFIGIPKSFEEYCYLDNIYLVIKDSDGTFSSMSTIWNFKASRPYSCDEYLQKKITLREKHKKALGNL